MAESVMLMFGLAIEDGLALYALHRLVCWVEGKFDELFKGF